MQTGGHHDGDVFGAKIWECPADPLQHQRQELLDRRRPCLIWNGDGHRFRRRHLFQPQTAKGIIHDLFTGRFRIVQHGEAGRFQDGDSSPFRKGKRQMTLPVFQRRLH